MDWSSRFGDTFASMPVCVTGGAGFIGSHLVDALVALGAQVRVIDDLSHGRQENLAAARDQISFIRASILDDSVLGEAIDGCSVVFHQAALGSVPHSVEEPALFHEVNAIGTLRVLEQARTAGVERVIYAASSSAYGDSDTLPKIESMPVQPTSPYASSKLAGELMLHAFCACYDLDGVSLRYFNIFGPRQRPDSQYAAVVPAFAEALIEGRRPDIFGDGNQSRDFTHVDNVVSANLLAAAAPKRLEGAVLNIACGGRFTLRELLRTLADILSVEPVHESRPPRAGDVQHSQADITRAGALIGYDVITDLHRGLKETLSALDTARA